MEFEMNNEYFFSSNKYVTYINIIRYLYYYNKPRSTHKLEQ